ncbi:MAG TPA: efflux RND transporter periplasmic adaptor subunit [Gammaproteobacteria bacterium]|nr:efflux RND transporter periplasmic adaptor subunit [Gammaproteobacteria bacterium]
MFAKHAKLLVTLLIIAGLIAALVFWLSREKPVAVIVKKVETGVVQETVSNTRAGTIKACRRAGLSPSIGGQIASLPVKEGDRVKQGQVLMELWNKNFVAQYELAKSELRATQATANQVCVRAEVAMRESERQKQLQKKNLSSEEAVDRADGEARAKKAACKAARVTIDVRKANLSVIQAEIDRTRLTAPFDGTVAEINGEIGEVVTPSPVGVPTPPAVDLMDVSCLYVSAPIDEVDAPHLRVDMKTKISLDAFPNEIFQGRVRRIAPYILEVEKQARTIDVEVDFLCQQDCENMLPGYSADIEVILDTKDNVTRIPTEAVLEGNKVLLFNAESRLEQREIKTGLSNWEWTEVTDGLSVGDEVVVSVDREGVEDGALAKRDTSAH